jgi:hypothetical protein
MKIRVTIVAASLVGLVACGGSTGNTGARATASSSSSSPAGTTATPTPTEQLNAAACDAAHQTMLKVKTAIDGWNGSTTDPATADQIRTYATELFSEEVRATGSAKDAIHNEAQGLVKFSIALSGSDDSAVGSAASEANAALAELRGVCGF